MSALVPSSALGRQKTSAVGGLEARKFAFAGVTVIKALRKGQTTNGAVNGRLTCDAFTALRIVAKNRERVIQAPIAA